jgi:hypothetical protein
MDIENVTMFYSGSMENNIFGTGFLVHKKYKHESTGFESVRKRLRDFKLRGKSDYTTIICAHEPTEAKYDISEIPMVSL